MNIPSVSMAAIFLLIVGGAVFMTSLPQLVLVVYVAASLVTFVIYAIDKSAAKKGARRTPENTLHLLALVGGWPGALIAQEKLRHKSQKQSFRRVFWLTVLLNVAVFIWLVFDTSNTNA